MLPSAAVTPYVTMMLALQFSPVQLTAARRPAISTTGTLTLSLHRNRKVTRLPKDADVASVPSAAMLANTTPGAVASIGRTVP